MPSKSAVETVRRMDEIINKSLRKQQELGLLERSAREVITTWVYPRQYTHPSTHVLQ